MTAENALVFVVDSMLQISCYCVLLHSVGIFGQNFTDIVLQHRHRILVYICAI